jgi:hypothetical protein
MSPEGRTWPPCTRAPSPWTPRVLLSAVCPRLTCPGGTTERPPELLPSPPSIPFRSFSRASSSFRSSPPRPPLPSGGAPPSRCCALPPSQPSMSPPSPRHAPPRARACPGSRSPEHLAAGADAAAPSVHVVRRPRYTSGRASTAHGCGWTSWSSSHHPPPLPVLSGRHRQPPAASPAWRRR